MDRNNLNEIEKISDLLAKETDKGQILGFIIEMLTKSELETFSKRWQILNMLKEGLTQREIAKRLKVSLCKVTRGAQILKNNESVVAKYLRKGKNNEY